MGLISSLVRSFRKSNRLRKLQLQISPPTAARGDVFDRFVASMETDARHERPLEEFLDLCEHDDGVAEVMRRDGLTRADLKALYVELSAAGLGQWVKGHYAALSSIAYVEPLVFTLEAKRQGRSMREIAAGLLQYWDGRIPQGALAGGAVRRRV